MVCTDYDLCDKCHLAGIHDQHQMLKIEHPEDYLKLVATVSSTAIISRDTVLINPITAL